MTVIDVYEGNSLYPAYEAYEKTLMVTQHTKNSYRGVQSPPVVTVAGRGGL